MIIRLESTFDKKLEARFLAGLDKLRGPEKVFARIDSVGGNLDVLNVMSLAAYTAITAHRCEIIAQIVRAESAAFIFAINMPVRQVMPNSVGQIHLPHLRKGEDPLDPGINSVIKREKAIEFIMRRTHCKLTRQEIIDLEGIPLGANEMLQYGIATEKVATF